MSGYRFTPAMIIGGIAGFFTKSYGTVSRQDSPRANGEAAVAGVIGAGVVAGALNIAALAAGSKLAD